MAAQVLKEHGQQIGRQINCLAKIIPELRRHFYTGLARATTLGAIRDIGKLEPFYALIGPQ
jgi:hypothetical protein